MFIFELFILGGVYALNGWDNRGGALLATQNYLFMIFLVFLTVYHGRASRRELAISKSEQALELKKVLVRFIGHEIRTPLNTVFLGLQYLDKKMKEDSLSNEELVDTVNDLKLSCDQSLEILNQLLIYDKIDSGLQKLDKTTFAVQPFIEETMRPFHLQAREGGIDLQLVIAPDTLAVLEHSMLSGDRSKLALVLRNLLSNALKFTKTALVREVRVTVDCDAGPSFFTDVPEPRQTMLSIRVTDSGVGMSQENITHLFQEVVQFSPERLQAGGGSGLGLWISHQIVSMHNGSLAASSLGDGLGSTFTLQLQLDIREHTVDVESVLPSRRPEEDGKEISIEVKMPINSILVVDDARLNRKLACKLLTGKVDVLDEAEDGLVAVEKVRQSMQSQRPYELILMDFVMPNMDGPTATKTIRELGYGGIIVGVTGNALAEDVDHFKAHGASDVLPKPLNMDALEATIAGMRRCLSQRHVML